MNSSTGLANHRRRLCNLLAVARLKNFARRLGIRSVIQRKDQVEITFGDQPNIDVQNVMALKEKFPARVSILPGPPEIIRLRTVKLIVSRCSSG